MSPEEDAQLETAVKLSGLTKQDYIIRKLLDKEVVVQGNPRVYKALRGRLLDEYGVCYENRAKHAGRCVTLTKADIPPLK